MGEQDEMVPSDAAVEAALQAFLPRVPTGYGLGRAAPDNAWLRHAMRHAIAAANATPATAKPAPTAQRDGFRFFDEEEEP